MAWGKEKEKLMDDKKAPPATGKEHLDASLETVSYKEREGYPYIIHPLMDGVPRVEPALLQEWADWAAGQVILETATLLLAPEAMGIPLAAALSLKTGIPYVVARKREYGMDRELVAYCETGYGTSCIHINDVRPDERVVVIDDVISTGGTAIALVQGLRSLDARVLGVLAPVAKGDGATIVRTKAEVPVATMRRLRFEDGQFIVE